MIKKNILERLMKLATFGVLLSASSCAATSAQDKPQKEAAAPKQTLTPAEHKMWHSVLKDWVETAVKTEGEHLYLYKDNVGNITWGIGTKYTRELFEKTQFKHANGTVLTKAEKKEYLTNARTTNSTKYKDFKALAKVHNVTIDLAHAKELAVQEGLEIITKIQPKIHSKFGVDINKLKRPAQMVVIDIAFNVGDSGIMKYKGLFNALEDGNYIQASRHVGVNAGGSKNKIREAMKKDLMKWSIALKNGKESEGFADYFEEKYQIAFPSMQTQKPSIFLATLEKGQIYDTPLLSLTSKNNTLAEQKNQTGSFYHLLKKRNTTYQG